MVDSRPHSVDVSTLDALQGRNEGTGIGNVSMLLGGGFDPV